jgi:uncharacterized glyoxalase superfamily protein PhnB
VSSNVWPNLGYRDAPAAIRFLVDAFGFEEEAVYAGQSESTIGHAVLRWPGGGGVTVHTAERNSISDLSERASADGGYPAYTVHVEVADPDPLFERAVAAGATVVRELATSALGRGFVVSDPEGLYWSFGTPLPPLVRDAEGNWRPREG